MVVRRTLATECSFEAPHGTEQGRRIGAIAHGRMHAKEISVELTDLTPWASVRHASPTPRAATQQKNLHPSDPAKSLCCHLVCVPRPNLPFSWRDKNLIAGARDQGVFMYWIPSSAFQMGQTLAMRNGTVRDFIGLQPLGVAPRPKAPPSSPSPSPAPSPSSQQAITAGVIPENKTSAGQ